MLKIFHYGRFDIAVMKHHLGVDTQPVYCTKIASKLARTYTDRHGLKDLVKELTASICPRPREFGLGGRDAEPRPDGLRSFGRAALHKVKAILDAMLAREGAHRTRRRCFDFPPTRARWTLRAGPATARRSATFCALKDQARAPGILLWTAQIAAFALLIAAWTQPLLSVRVTAAARLHPRTVPVDDHPRRNPQRHHDAGAAVGDELPGHRRAAVLFGVALPIVKNAGIVLLLASQAGTRSRGIAAALQFVGRFAMVDIFAVSIIVSVMAASTVGQGDNPGPAVVETITQLRGGFYLFVVYVLLSFAIDVALSLRAALRVTAAAAPPRYRRIVRLSSAQPAPNGTRSMTFFKRTVSALALGAALALPAALVAPALAPPRWRKRAPRPASPS